MGRIRSGPKQINSQDSTARKQTKRSHSESSEARRPEVILDIEFKEGQLFVVIANVGSKAALKVVSKFDRKIVGLGGQKQVNAMNIFKGIEFVPPGKELRFLLDNASSYFARRQPTKFLVEVSYKDSSGKRYREKIRHDLEIYRDMPFLDTASLG